MIFRKSLFFLLSFLVYCFLTSHAQNRALHDINQKFLEYCDQSLQEKVYVHLDRTYFLTGESLWIKVYVTNGSNHHLQDLSKVCLLEILDSENKPVLQRKIALEKGMGKGNIYLPLTLKSGNYKFRAYTSWMTNFDASYYFEENLTIVNSFVKPSYSSVRPEANYDIQFFPEGGALVNGIESKVAFRAVNRSGKGIKFKGVLLNDANDTITSFEPDKFGIGHFFFTPNRDEVYHSSLLIEDDTLFYQKFPSVQAEGYVMSLGETENEQLRIAVNSNLHSEEYLYLLIHTRQKLVFEAGKKIEKGYTEFLIDKSSLGEGISHITVFDYQKRPVCERLYFKYPEFVSLKAQTDKLAYATRKKVSLELTAEETENAVTSDFSVAVFALDSLNRKEVRNISSYLWLTSDLRGKVESADYYFEDQDPGVEKAVDNLMLTHGWRRFSWEHVFDKERESFDCLPEYEGHVIEAVLSDRETDEPVKNAAGFLSVPGRSGHFYSSKSDESGSMFFVTRNLYGKHDIILQLSSGVGRQSQLKVLSPFSEKFSETIFPTPFVLSEDSKGFLQNRHKFMQTQNLYWDKELNAIDTSLLETKDFYGHADKKYILNNYTQFPTMEEVMREYVAEVIVRKKTGDFYFRVVKAQQEIHDDNPLVLLNNVPIFDINKIMSYNPLKFEKIEIVKDGFISGGSHFNGIVSYSTYDRKMVDFDFDPSAVQQTFDGLHIPKEFYSPMYGDDVAPSDPRPDFRNLLYWNPEVKLVSGKPSTFNFYTSDVSGKYFGVVQGITNEGKTGFETFSFVVEDPVN